MEFALNTGKLRQSGDFCSGCHFLRNWVIKTYFFPGTDLPGHLPHHSPLGGENSSSSRHRPSYHLIPHTGDSSDDDDSRTNSLHLEENDAAEDLSFRALSYLGFEFDVYYLVFVESTGTDLPGHLPHHSPLGGENSSSSRHRPSYHLIPHTGDSSDDDDSRTNSLHLEENDAAEDLSFRALSYLGFEFDVYYLVFVESTGTDLPGHLPHHSPLGGENSSSSRHRPSYHLIPHTGDSSDDDDSRTNSLHLEENDAAEDLASRYLKKIGFDDPISKEMASGAKLAALL
ncbi:hypothetical protein CRG98_012226 [Punica granatum]|uniref:Uncharacterized protein n=1 Tax=Punica granatum TaxID=22663 RepID=A0A2I0KFU6_PUNGR|nr:hypothetical protein CRG98_012226 [Punica granatum]